MVVSCVCVTVRETCGAFGQSVVLSFKSQVQSTEYRANYHLKNSSFLKNDLEENLMLLLVHNHVIIKLDDCSSLYSPAPDYYYLSRNLQLVMNRAARLINGLPHRPRITPTLIDSQWLPFKARISVQKMSFSVSGSAIRKALTHQGAAQ